MDPKLAQYKIFRNFINKMLFWSGIWPHCEDFRFYYRIITFLAILMSFSFATKVISYGLWNISTVSILVQSLSTALGQYTLVLKVVSFLLYRKDLVLLDKELGRTFEEELQNENNRPLLLQGISVYKRFLYGISGFFAFVTFVFFNGPIIHAFRDKIYRLPYKGNYPFTVVPASSLYWILLFCESSSIWFTFNVTNGVDNAFGLHCFRACGLLRLTALRWTQIQPNDPNSSQQIRQCVQIHQLVIRSKDRLQRVYGFIVLWNYVTTSLILCSILWQANQAGPIWDLFGFAGDDLFQSFFHRLQNEPSYVKRIHSHSKVTVMHNITLVKIIFIVSYIMFKSLQAFTYAYYGSLVSQESENYQDAIYFSNWPGSGNLRLMKDILFVHTQRMITLKASGFFYITMDMFEKVMKTSFSYFFLMQTIESKQ